MSPTKPVFLVASEKKADSGRHFKVTARNGLWFWNFWNPDNVGQELACILASLHSADSTKSTQATTWPESAANRTPQTRGNHEHR